MKKTFYITEIRADSHSDSYTFVACNESGEPPVGASTVTDANGEESLVKLVPWHHGLTKQQVEDALHITLPYELIEVEVYYGSDFIKELAEWIFQAKACEESHPKWLLKQRKPGIASTTTDPES